MFIDKMSSEELLQEYRKDLPEIRERTRSFDATNFVGDCLWKHRRQNRVVIPKQIVTKRGNRYIGVLIYTQTGCGKSKLWDWNSYHVGLMNTNKGVLALSFYEERSVAVKMTPHFFQRYRERMMAVCDWKVKSLLMAADSYEKIVTTYIQRNLGSSWVETKVVYNDKQHIFAPVPDGVSLMQWDERNRTLQANTFVTYDMLNKTQLDMVKRLVIYGKSGKDERDGLGISIFSKK